MRLLRVSLLLLPFLILPAPAAPPGGPASPSPREEAERSLREMESRLARVAAAKDVEAFLSLWAEDAATFSPGDPVAVGREKVREEWGPLLRDPGASLTWEPDRVEASQSGDLGYTYGRYESRRTGADGKRVVRTGKYVTIWRKEKDGRWRVVLDIGSPDPPPAEQRAP